MTQRTTPLSFVGQLRKAGQSLILTVPKEITELMGLAEGQYVQGSISRVESLDSVLMPRVHVGEGEYAKMIIDYKGVLLDKTPNSNEILPTRKVGQYLLEKDDASMLMGESHDMAKRLIEYGVTSKDNPIYATAIFKYKDGAKKLIQMKVDRIKFKGKDALEIRMVVLHPIIKESLNMGDETGG